VSKAVGELREAEMAHERDPDLIIIGVQDCIGLDAYHAYPDEKRSIAADILTHIAQACVLDFIFALTGLNRLPDNVREKASAAIDGWKRKRGMEEFARAERIDIVVAEAIASLPQEPSSESRAAARRHLEASLKEFGLNEANAKRKARLIEDIVLDGG
jgi:hypothetical protein